MSRLRRLQSAILLGLVLIAGPAFYAHRAGWFTPIYRMIQRSRWHRTEITSIDLVMRSTERTSPWKLPEKRTTMLLKVRHPAEGRSAYTINTNGSMPTITLDGRALCFDELIATLTKEPLEFISKASAFGFGAVDHHWFDDKAVYIRRDGDQIIAIRILTSQ